ncbi:MAG: hypothetical protein H6634_13375 [Anaerolineales bacterium]|nr:hypothetical protein [Anaerolineales bacterium]
MNVTKTIGLGEPEVTGKKSLFQPPAQKKAIQPEIPKRVGEGTPRIRITTDLSKGAMQVIQGLRDQHRLQTGKSLPAWRIVSVALEQYGRKKREEDAKAE